MADTSIPLPVGFSEMSKSEQIRDLQSLWDQIATSPGDLPVPESYLEPAEARLKRYRDDPCTVRSAFEAL